MKEVGETQPICGLSSPLLPVFRGCVFKSRIKDNQTKTSLINAYLCGQPLGPQTVTWYEIVCECSVCVQIETPATEKEH